MLFKDEKILKERAVGAVCLQRRQKRVPKDSLTYLTKKSIVM
ncbi:hypothetical protein [Pediococcus acidilactici]|uniref:Uncharacterized protein n=1 Tax=Pediococcus acidilactici DSM 20284 TaxID=862514 RepID=E0NGR3_PEDAC|nr:hypothetical protein HMPREF0623_1110 [Pediococcus acidilactici DSM 20284]